MEDGNTSFNKEFYKILEKGIGELPEEARERLYRSCAVNCASGFVLKNQQQQFNECNCNLDLQYEKYGRTEYFFADIIERGHIYEIGYPCKKCLCPMVEEGLATTSVHCECSKQSILYVLQTLQPDKKFHIEIMHSVLTGAEECRFRVVVE